MAVISTLTSRLEVIRSMESFVGAQVDELLKPVSESWQPADLLPDMHSESWVSELTEVRDGAKALPDSLLVALVGDTITEEALPSYQTWLNGLSGVSDKTGASDTAWARWSRGWTAEENRHGDLLNRYLYLSGRVDMKAVETTIQHLIRNGFDPLTENDPYQGFIYTSFQERATKISHRNVSILAGKVGESKLQTICGLIAGDEARHERAYTNFARKIFELDPGGAVLAFASMMRKRIVMPARLMEPGLFDQFAIVAQSLGVYTIRDYASIMAHLVEAWDVPRLKGLSGEESKAQAYVCGLSKKFEALAQRMKPLNFKMKFSWVHNREINIDLKP